MTPPPATGEMLLTNCRIFGGTGWTPPVWYHSLRISEGRIEALGDSNQALNRSTRECQVINLDGALVLPGLGDAHMHLKAGARSLLKLDLAGLNRDEIKIALQRRLLDEPHPIEGWIQAFDWESWRGILDARLLDEVSLDLPMVVFSRDLHSCCVNSRALKIAGIGATTEAPPNGIISRDAGGIPSGILRDHATDLVMRFIPQNDPSQGRRLLVEGQRYLASVGVTCVSDVLEVGQTGIYHDLDRDEELDLFIDGWLRFEQWDGVSSPPPAGKHFQVNTLKLFLDGSFGSKTAALYQPFSEESDNTGLLFFTDVELLEKIVPAVGSGWRLALHAIGDRAVDQACRVLARLPRTGFTPHRIEHLQLLSETGVEHLVESGAVGSVQPVHYLDDSPWLATRIGRDRCQRAFIWRSLVEHSIPLALGTDWPVASPNPFLNLHAAINRRGFSQPPHPDFDLSEALLPHLAIRAMTWGWAEAAGLKEKRGAIEAGFPADLTIVSGVSEDLADWSRARVDMTICSGKVVYTCDQTQNRHT